MYVPSSLLHQMLETVHVCLVSVKYCDQQVLDVRYCTHGTADVQAAAGNQGVF